MILLLFSTAFSQELTITVREASRKSLPGATLLLKHLGDSTKRNAVTDLNGKAVFADIKQGLYSLRISYIGYVTLEKNVTIREGKQMLDYRLSESTTALGEVTITASRPLIRQEGDKMIIDPEPIAATSTNTLEVLESTPGLYVDQDGGIFLSSATPAVIYINGRQQKMSNQDIATLLRSLPPESILRIEVLRTPSTKYDAASSGGVVNIVLKKGVKLGRFGSVNAGMNQGVYGNQFVGFNFNNSGDKTTVYLTTNVSLNDGFEELNSVREMATDTNLTQAARTRNKNKQGYIGYGITYDISEKLSLSYDGRLNLSNRNSNSRNSNRIETLPSFLLLESDNRIENATDFLSIQQDLGLNLKIDSLDSDWDTRFSYSYTGNTASQNYSTVFLFPISGAFSGEGDNEQLRHFVQFQTDLSLALPYKIKMESGVKSSWQQYSSTADFFKNTNGTLTNDGLRTQSFRYEEAINAAYFQASRPLPLKFELKVGVRMEHTYMNGRQRVPSDTGFVINRADWFPYIYLSRPLIEMFGVKLMTFLIYRKTINRPDYQNLNPYIRFVDQFMYETGNPALKPQFTDNLELNISFDDMPVFAFGQNQTRDIFSSVIYQDKAQKGVSVRTYDNLGKSKETYLRVMGGIPPGGRYFFALGSQYNLNEYDGFYEGQALQYKRGNWRFFTFHSLKLFKETRLTMSGFMMLNGNYGFLELHDFGALNFGLTQTFFKQKLRISLNARDVLKTMVTEFELLQGSMPSYGNRYTDNRRFGINIRYSFGLKKKEERKLIPDMEE